MSGDPFELPVCSHCERWASWHHIPPGSAYCWYCGTVTAEPVTVEEWFEKELKIRNIYEALRRQGIDYTGAVDRIVIEENGDDAEPGPEDIIISR
jgi:hypothetical protein